MRSLMEQTTWSKYVHVRAVYTQARVILWCVPKIVYVYLVEIKI